MRRAVFICIDMICMLICLAVTAGAAYAMWRVTNWSFPERSINRLLLCMLIIAITLKGIVHSVLVGINTLCHVSKAGVQQ